MRQSMILKPTLACIIAAGSASSCGSKEETPPETVVYASTVVVNSATESENKSTELTSLSKCDFDAKSGLFEGEFSNGSGAQLTVNIKNFANKDSAYTCEQDPENKTGDVSFATFTTCSVAFSTGKTPKENTYTMYREETAIDDLAFAGACSIDVKYDSDSKKISSTISCTDLIQSHYQGQKRNPIDESVTADLASTSMFSCTLR